MIFVSYDPDTGEIQKRLTVPDQETAEANSDGYPVIEAEVGVSDETHIIVDGVLHLRETVSISADRSTVAPDGIDAATITLPDPCWLSVGGTRVLVEGGSYTFTTATAGRYEIEAAGIHRSNILTVEAKLPDPVRYSRLEWFSRFTLPEHGAVISSTDPIVRAIYDRTMAAEFIDPADPRTADGVGYLVLVGIITAERASAIIEGHGE